LSSSIQKLIPEKRALQRSLLRWYARCQRDLPWRKKKDPYRILVSEFMLQQTRVETVQPYFERFLKLFPTLPALAQASLPQVLKAWAGLGYYARARHLHEAAKIIRRDFGGKIPPRKQSLLSLPGFGPYTAGAVASLAFNQPEPALDGNVRRWLSRCYGLGRGFPKSQTERLLENFVKDLIPHGRASDFNQALMELGALICTPSQPRCPLCPVKKFCFRRSGNDERKKRTGKKIRAEVWIVALVEQKGRFLLHRKEGTGLLAGLWQFPTLVIKGDGNAAGSKERKILRQMLQLDFGVKVKIKRPLPLQKHSFTHRQVTMKPLLCSAEKFSPPLPPSRQVRWIKPVNFGRYPISTAMSKISALILNPGGNNVKVKMSLEDRFGI
jgi:A/G-specific adenine glycosylase